MDKTLVNEFVKQARSIGMPEQKIAQLLGRAEEISSRGQVKSATENLDRIVGNLLYQAGLDKTASSVAYTNGILKQALDSGATPDQAINSAADALTKTSEDLVLMSKLAAVLDNEDLAAYAEGFMKSATNAGMSKEDAAHSVIKLIEREKYASDPSQGQGNGIFKQSVTPPSPGGDPGAGGPPGAGAGQDGPPGAGGPPPGPGGEPDVTNILQQLPPEVLQQILAMISSGQGGPGGMPPQGAPPGMPPQGAPPGMPPQGGPGGPAAGLAQ